MVKSVKRILKPHVLGTFVSLLLLLLCSCTTDNFTHSRFPAAVAMNQDAGYGGFLEVMVRLEDGRELPFILDTGASGTCFDKSLEPQLGKRLGTGSVWKCGTNEVTGIY